MSRPALIVHGGAGAANPELSAVQQAGCATAVAAGWKVLTAGGAAVDAVCAAVAVLEDDPAFNAGVGSCLTGSGTVEMDASVMDGNGLRAGAAALVRTVRHPVELARALMEDGRQLLLAGADADAFARRCGLATCAPEDLVTERERHRWQQRRDQPDAAGTVGAAAVDRAGHVAAATSTGGMSYKSPGRIGDSAVIGAGTYADDGRGAASSTGEGEAIIRVTLAKCVVDSLADGSEAQLAARTGVRYLEQRVGGRGGIVVVDLLGRLGYAHNTPHMTVGFMHGDLSVPVIQT